MSNTLTNALLGARNFADVSSIIRAETPRYHGYKVVEVTLDNGVLAIIGEGSISNGWSNFKDNVIVLKSNLRTGIDLIGRRHHAGLTRVDMEIIRNVMQII